MKNLIWNFLPFFCCCCSQHLGVKGLITECTMYCYTNLRFVQLVLHDTIKV